MKKVMIDSGHYPNHANKGQTGYREYQGVWKISNYLKEFLEKQGIQADLTKTYEETFNNDRDLTIRGKKAQGYDLFISQHTNGHNDSYVRGVECFYDFSKPEDEFWANELSKAVSELMNNPNRGAKTRTYIENGKTLNYYGVIRGASATNCPHIFLIESGFHSNLEDEAFLKIDDNLKKIAEIQAEIICKILGIEVKEMTLDNAKKIVQEKAELDDNSIQYLEYYRYGEDLIKKLAGAMVKEAIVEPPKPNTPKVETSKVEFTRYNNGMTELKGNPENLVNEIVDKRIYDITEFTNCTNGVFYMLQGNGKTHPTSILYEDGITYQAVANHYKDFGCPQSVFIIHKDNTVDMKRIKNLSELNLNNIRLVVGGLGLINTQDPKFYYSPVTEGFKRDYASNGVLKDFSDVLRKTNKTVLGYNKRLNKCYLLTVPNVSHGELIKIISDNSTGEAYDIAISMDGGGSSFQDANWEYVFKGQNSRQIYNILRFK